MANSFFNGAFFGGEFFNTPVTPPSSGTVLGGAGHASRSQKKRRKIIVGERLYEVDSLRDVELLLKRVVRTEAEPVTRAAVRRTRVVDRATARLDKEPAVALPVASVEVDWSGLWAQLAVQDRAYADLLMRVLDRIEEDELEMLLLLH